MDTKQFQNGKSIMMSYRNFSVGTLALAAGILTCAVAFA